MDGNADDENGDKSPADSVRVDHVDNNVGGIKVDDDDDGNDNANIKENDGKGQATDAKDLSGDTGLPASGHDTVTHNKVVYIKKTSSEPVDANGKTVQIPTITTSEYPSINESVTKHEPSLCQHPDITDAKQQYKQATGDAHGDSVTEHDSVLSSTTPSEIYKQVPIDVTTTVLTDSKTKEFNQQDKIRPQESHRNGEIFTTITSKYDGSNSEMFSKGPASDDGVIRDASCDQTKNNKDHPKGILKNAKSFPVLAVSDRIGGSHPKFFKHALSAGLIETQRDKPHLFQKKNFASITNSLSSPDLGTNYFRSTQEFVNPAFELDEAIPKDSRLADIVEQVLKNQPEQNRYVHPFGKSNMYATVLLGEQSKYQSMGRFIFWIMFALGIAGVAGAIIIMSEMHRVEMESAGSYMNMSNGI